MHTSEAVKDFLENKPIVPEENREEELKKILRYFQYKPNRSLTYNYLHMAMAMAMAMALLLIPLVDNSLIRIFVAGISFVITPYGILWLLSLLIGPGEMKYEIKENLHELFRLLSEKPYEFRTSWESCNSTKLKIIVEENQLLEGGHVIKDKSRHFTAYIDAAQSSESIVKAVMAMVQKAESTFK